MRVRINFSGSRIPPRTASVALLILGIASVGGALWQYRDAYRCWQFAESALTAVRAQQRPAPAALPLQAIAAANHVIHGLNLPWQPLLTALENHLSGDVALLAIEPEAESRRLRILAEAKSAEQMFDFVAALRGDSSFVSSSLLRHEINDGDRNRPYRFTMVLEWAASL